MLSFTGFFRRCFGGEFGNAIRGCIGKLSASYFLIIIYCGIMFGKQDLVHSGITFAVAAVVIVGLTIGSIIDLMVYLGVPNTQLNNNFYFLFRGLGVGDAFALASTFGRHTMLHPELSSAERVSRTACSDDVCAHHFCHGCPGLYHRAATVLPVLGWFGTWA